MKKIFVLFMLVLTFAAMSACTDKKERAFQTLNEGKTKFYNNDFRGAIISFTASLSYVPGFDQALYYRANCYFNLSILDSAMADYNACIVSSPGFSDAYANRGKLKFASGDREGACMDWTKAKELGNQSMSERLQNCN